MGQKDLVTRKGDTTPKRWDDSFLGFHREMNNLFSEFFRDFYDMEPSALQVAVDVQETDKEVQVTVELPGIEEKDLELSLHKDSLTIKGEKKQESQSSEGNFHRVERSYGSFQRTVALPCEVEDEKAEATYKKGVLHIKLPKKKGAAQERKKIAIQSV
ncbi:MAG: molecular chaperone [Spirochaetaceae bacterium]|nr:molecular chaperone [Spirochaetaceae bacterium]|tara:strand:+ start:131812 stop:132285 length:474 start_codon:yes stop_codon:yes gene_type:complete